LNTAWFERSIVPFLELLARKDPYRQTMWFKRKSKERYISQLDGQLHQQRLKIDDTERVIKMLKWCRAEALEELEELEEKM